MKKIVILILMIFILTGCASNSSGSLINKYTDNGLVYNQFVIEGMPCMRIGRSVSGNLGVWQWDGITCDWSKWDGNK